MAELPVLWSFRRCPYAMRARLAVRKSGVKVELREIVLRDKPEAFLETSPSGTVPCLKAGETVIDESLDVMIWALKKHDPEGWLEVSDEGWDLIAQGDGPFKSALDRTKYATRYPDVDASAERQKASAWLHTLDERLAKQHWLTGNKPTICDFAILPFVRQFANIDRAWFDEQDWPHLHQWLQGFLVNEDFAAIMDKYPAWSPDQPIVPFP